MTEKMQYYKLNIRIPCDTGGCWEEIYISGKALKISHPSLQRANPYAGSGKIESKLEEISKEEFEEVKKEIPYGLWWLRYENG